MENDLRKALRQGRPAFGSWIQFGHLGIAEMMAQAGFDWLGIDMEHSAIGIETAQQLIQVIELSGSVPLVRLPDNDPVIAKRVMDAGAHGIIVPNVNSSRQAELAVRSIKYPPAGFRGVGLSRAQGYGARFQKYVSEANEQSVVIVMIEHREGVEQIADIVRVPGVDAVFVGPYDLSASYGISGQLDHPLLRDAMATIIKAAIEANVAAGIHVVHPPLSQVKDRLSEGFRFIAYGGDMLLLLPAVQAAGSELRTLSGQHGGS